MLFVGGLFNLLARGAGLLFGAEAVRDVATRLSVETRPAVKAAVRAGMTVGDHLERWTAGAREQVEDIIEEARAERRQDGEQRRP